MQPDSLHTPQPTDTIAVSDTLAGIASHEPIAEYESFTFFENSIDTLPQLFSYHSDTLSILSGDRFQGSYNPTTLASDTGILLLSLLVFMGVALTFRKGAKFFTHILDNIFKTKERNSIFDDTTINETQLRVSLIALTVFTEGIVLYSLLPQLPPAIAPSFVVLAYSLLCLLYYWVQRGVYSMLGNIFSEHSRAEKFDESFVSINLLLGLLLSPAALLIIFVPATRFIAIYICIFFYILARLTIIYKGIRIFSPRIFGWLYIILYLCALEIAPLLLMRKAISVIYQFVEFNLLGS